MAAGRVDRHHRIGVDEGGLQLVARVQALRDQRPRLSLREVAAELEREHSKSAAGYI